MNSDIIDFVSFVHGIEEYVSVNEEDFNYDYQEYDYWKKSLESQLKNLINSLHFNNKDKIMFNLMLSLQEMVHIVQLLQHKNPYDYVFNQPFNIDCWSFVYKYPDFDKESLYFVVGEYSDYYKLDLEDDGSIEKLKNELNLEVWNYKLKYSTVIQFFMTVIMFLEKKFHNDEEILFFEVNDIMINYIDSLNNKDYED